MNRVPALKCYFQDYFALVPKEYFEPLILKENIYDSCLAGVTLPYCMQYGYPDVSQHPTALSEQHSQRPGGSLGDVYWFPQQASKLILLLQSDYVGFNTGNEEKLSYSPIAGLVLLGCSIFTFHFRC